MCFSAQFRYANDTKFVTDNKHVQRSHPMGKMATFMGKLLLFLSVYVSQVKAQDDFGIKEPFPEDIYPIEGTETKVTCVAFDSLGVKTPERIQFMRRDKFSRYTNITGSENVIFTERRESAVPPASEKLIVTMTIKSVTLNDDSTYGALGRYECHAFAVGDPVVRIHGFSVNVIKNEFGIKEPFPEDIYPIEGTETKVTCVAFDSLGVKTPERIQFMRRDQFARYTNITASENVIFTERRESAVPPASEKLIVTMTIKNVTLNDDSRYGALGRYECHAFAVGEPVRIHGFSVNVILRDEIPSVTVSKISQLRHGGSTTLTCKITKQDRQTGLKRISWYKGGVLLESFRNPDPDQPLDTLSPLVLLNIGVRDGGNYTCLLEVKLRNIRNYNVSDSTMVEIAPWFDKPTEVTEVTAVEGQDVSLPCAAQGFPLHVEWKLQKDSEDFVRSCINGSDGKYHVHRSGIYDPYVLTVSDVRYTDLGSYYCCLSSNCSDNIQDNCQHFVLRGGSENSSICKGCLLASIILSAIMNFLTKKP